MKSKEGDFFKNLLKFLKFSDSQSYEPDPRSRRPAMFFPLQPQVPLPEKTREEKQTPAKEQCQEHSEAEAARGRPGDFTAEIHTAYLGNSGGLC